VDAKNERSAAYYQARGFIPFPSMPLRLFIHIDTVRRHSAPRERSRSAIRLTAFLPSAFETNLEPNSRLGRSCQEVDERGNQH
jgi:hypothetical protein